MVKYVFIHMFICLYLFIWYINTLLLYELIIYIFHMIPYVIYVLRPPSGLGPTSSACHNPPLPHSSCYFLSHQTGQSTKIASAGTPE